MTPERMHEVFYKRLREEQVQAFMKDKEAIKALKLLIDKGYSSPTIREAYFFIKEDMENEK